LVFLDSCLEELAPIWPLAGEARKKFWTVLRLRREKVSDGSSRSDGIGGSGGISDSLAPVDDAGDQNMASSLALPRLDEEVALNSEIGSGQYLWDTLALMDDEASYWWSMPMQDF
jgi:hypothetical protein